jgi:DNA repair protein RadC
MELREVKKSIEKQRRLKEEKAISELEKLRAENELTIKENIHKDHRQRLKTQFLMNGFESLTDVQKLELLLFYAIPQKDTNPLAHELINKFENLKNVLKANQKDLIEVNGIKENTALFLSLINSMLNFCNQPDLNEVIDSTHTAKEYISKFYFNVDVEQFHVFCISKSNKVIKHVLLKSGTIDEVNVQIRHITQVALDAKCNRIIVSHNHPNGKGTMSDEDCAFTYSLMCSCLLNSIDILDHIIVGTDRTISLTERGVMEKLKARAFKNLQLPQDKREFLSSSSEAYTISKVDEDIL